MKSDFDMVIALPDARATVELGSDVGRKAFPGLLISLVGPLGAGKTTLVKGVIEGMGGDPAQVASPTFTIANSYDTPHGTLLHADLYRLGRDAFIDDTGVHEALDAGTAVVAVEWAEHLESRACPEVVIELELAGQGSRRSRKARVRAHGGAGRILDHLIQFYAERP